MGLLYQLLCKHKTVATLEPIRGVSLLTCINEGGTTLRRPFEDVVFCFHFSFVTFGVAREDFSFAAILKK